MIVELDPIHSLVKLAVQKYKNKNVSLSTSFLKSVKHCTNSEIVLTHGSGKRIEINNIQKTKTI